MAVRSVFTGFLILATIGLLVLRANLADAGLAPAARYARAVGFSLTPWIAGLVVAAITCIARRRHPLRGRFRDSLEGAALVMLLLLYGVTLYFFA